MKLQGIILGVATAGLIAVIGWVGSSIYSQHKADQQAAAEWAANYDDSYYKYTPHPTPTATPVVVQQPVYIPAPQAPTKLIDPTDYSVNTNYKFNVPVQCNSYEASNWSSTTCN